MDENEASIVNAFDRYEKGQLTCSFCGKFHDQVKILFLGVEGRICDECVEFYHDEITRLTK